MEPVLTCTLQESTLYSPCPDMVLAGRDADSLSWRMWGRLTSGRTTCGSELAVSSKWVGDCYSFKISSGSFGSEGISGDWMCAADAQKQKPAAFRVLLHKEHNAPTEEFSQSISDRVELECGGPVTALIRWATVQKI